MTARCYIGAGQGDESAKTYPSGTPLAFRRSRSSAEEFTRLIPKRSLVLGQALEFIREDERVEVTPQNVRLRKVLLAQQDRAKAARRGPAIYRALSVRNGARRDLREPSLRLEARAPRTEGPAPDVSTMCLDGRARRPRVGPGPPHRGSPTCAR
jgi:hypothetical protein